MLTLLQILTLLMLQTLLLVRRALMNWVLRLKEIKLSLLCQILLHNSRVFVILKLFPQHKEFVEKTGKQYGTKSDKQIYSGPFKVENWEWYKR